jgi:CBS domain-containing protein
MKVNQIMTAHARCVAPDNTLVEAAGLMRELDVGALPVCEIDRVAGMVTDRDIVLRGVADGRDANTTLVRDVMSQGAFHIFADQSVEEAARLMEDKQIRRLPVLDRNKRLVGIVSLGDLAVTSNPAFSGIALKEVSLTAKQRMRDESPRILIRSDGSNGRGAETPRGTRQTKRAGTKARRASSGSRSTARGGKRKTSARKTQARSGKSAAAGNRRRRTARAR